MLLKKLTKTSIENVFKIFILRRVVGDVLISIPSSNIFLKIVGLLLDAVPINVLTKKSLEFPLNNDAELEICP